MEHTRRELLLAFGGLLSSARLASVYAQGFASYTDSDREALLLGGMVVSVKDIGEGVTKPIQAELSWKGVTHSAQIQRVDKALPDFYGKDGTVLPARDAWRYNIAAYRLDRLLQLNMVPVSVERRWNYKDAAFTWWLDDVMMDEQERLKRKQEPADVGMWNQQMQMVRVFDELIANVDRNLGNLIISKDWRLWPIDHTRAFRTNHELKKPANVTRADRAVVERMKALDKETLRKATSKYLTTFQIDAILARRDAIVKRLDSLGPASLYDRSGW